MISKIYSLVLIVCPAFLFSQEICQEFQIVDLDFLPESEWGNQLIFYMDIPDTSIYAPYFYLQTDDEYFEIIDSITSYFWITGPTIIDLHYLCEYDTIPYNHTFLGSILMVSGDEQLICDIPFEFSINIENILGDVNNDGVVDVVDVSIVVNVILGNDSNASADLNGDGIIDVLDIVLLLNIILGQGHGTQSWK